MNAASAALGWVAALIARLPYRALGPLGALVGLLVGEALRVRRAEVTGRLRRAGFAEPTAIARAMYLSLGRGLFELLWAGGRPGRSLAARVRLTERAIAVLASLEGRGAVLASAHTGNWDLAACAVAETYALLVVTKRLHVRALDGLWQGLRSGRGVSLVSGRGSLTKALAALGEGSLVAIMIDQAPEGRGRTLVHPFLGLPAKHDRLAATLAARSGRPLLVTFPKRERDGSHLLDIVDVITPPSEGARAGWVDEATKRGSAALEAFVRQQPEQWLWLHRRWKGVAATATEDTTAPAPTPMEGARAAAPAPTEDARVPWPRPAGHGSAPGP
ncbi:MAG: lysophospholipid acyltransferase family protein [Polyangiaceae bacterium]|nr:lysophospholipid acyltransferase family protein [Polyangiaceae bacterium]